MKPKSSATPSLKTARGQYSGQTHDLESFIFKIRKEQPALSRAKCLAVLYAEVAKDQCVESPIGVFTWKWRVWGPWVMDESEQASRLRKFWLGWSYQVLLLESKVSKLTDLAFQSCLKVWNATRECTSMVDTAQQDIGKPAPILSEGLFVGLTKLFAPGVQP